MKKPQSLTKAQVAGLEVLRAALSNPSPEVKMIREFADDKESLPHIRVFGINGNVINSLVRVRAISYDNYVGAVGGGHWISGLTILV